MTAAEWLACGEPARMLGFVTLSRRKQKLFCVACCWRIRRLVPDYSQQILTTLECSAERPLSAKKALALSDDAMAYADGLSYRMGTPEGCARWPAASAVWAASDNDTYETARDAACAIVSSQADPASFNIAVPAPPCPGDPAEQLAQAGMLRCILGNPFRPVKAPLAWRTTTVKALCPAIYKERSFHYMPILADALEDAGCDNADILDHCRKPGEHVRGCWVLDLLLDKS